MAKQTAFDGATQGFRLEQKGLLSGGPDSLAAREIKLLRDRSHHLCRNNAAAITARNRLAAHWVGSGIKVKWNNKKVQKLWDAFAKNPSVDGWGDLSNLQNLWAGSFFESGEVFTRMMLKKRDDMRIPLQLQTLEAEQLDPFFNQPDNTRNGIKFDGFGKPVTYYFYQRNPYDGGLATGLNDRVPVDAKDVLHIFQRDRPGQWRGVPKLSGVLLPIYEMDELTDATLVRQKAAQAIGWVIKKTGVGKLPLVGDIEAAVDEETGTPTRIQRVLPGGVHYLEEDEEFDFASTDDIGTNLVVLLTHQWRMIASALDVTYEQLTGDLTGVNFSSIRAGLIEFRRRVALVQQLIFVNLALRPLAERFLELAALYEGVSKDATCKFVFPKTEWVDPLKDSQSDILEIRAGLATLAEKLSERGVDDIEAHLAQLAVEQGFEIILDSNPKHNTQDQTTIKGEETDSPVTQTKPEPKPAKKKEKK